MSGKDFGDRFDLLKFFELMYEYRTAPAGDPVNTAFEAVKEFARSTPKQGEAADPHAPKELFLQLYGDSSADEGLVDYEAGDVSWCWHRINDSDVRYVQAAPPPSVEPAPDKKDSNAIETLMKVAAYLGITEAEERARPGYDPSGPASATIIAAIERHRATPLQQVEPGWVSDAARDVLAERARQISAEGWTPEHDDEHNEGTLAQAGACYARWAFEGKQMPNWVPTDWPWADEWWKAGDPRRNLIKATSLILAEVERFDRATATK